MSSADLIGAIDELPRSAWRGTAYRHVAAGRSPLSGEGARIAGGRWNPPRSFAVLYLGLTAAAVVAEFHRLADRQRLAPADFLPRTFHTYEVELAAVLDLRDDDALASVALDRAQLQSDDLRPCQAVGEAAFSTASPRRS